MDDKALLASENISLKHEVDYLKSRVESIEKFKSYFFKAKTDLVIANTRVSLLESELMITSLKKRMLNKDEDKDEDEDKKEVKPAKDSLITDANIINYIKDNLSSQKHESLIESMFRTIKDTGLEMVVKIMSYKDEAIIYSSVESLKTEGTMMFDKHTKDGFFVIDNQSCIQNMNHIRVFLKNSPAAEHTKEILKEFSMIVCMSANEKLISFDKDIELDDLKKNIYKIFKKTHSSFDELQDKMDQQMISVSEMVMEYECEMIEAVSKMNIPEQHRKDLLSLLMNMKLNMNLLLTQGLCIDKDFLSVVIKLESAYATQYSNI